MALGIFPLIAFLLLLPVWADAQTVGNVTVGASLSAHENSHPWVSPSGDFAFGFHQLRNNKNLFLLAIWYNKIPENTLVWYANGDSPAPRGSKLQLADRGFVLNSPQGEQLWNSETRSGVVDSGIMDDSGNFKLLGGSSILWESFKDPADTVLPSQILDKGVALSSRQSETNFSKGRFQMVLQSDGDLVLATVNLPSKHAQLKTFTTEQLSISTEFSHYTLTPKASTGKIASWTALWSEPDNICTAAPVGASSGVCGFNSICSLNAEKRPSCGCPRSYTLIDPSNQYGNCKPNFTQNCEQEAAPAEDLYEFEELTNVDWPLADYALLEPFTEDQCRESCLHDCMCAVAIFRLGDKCWKKKLPLSNGRLDPGLDGGKALLKVRKGGRPPFCPYFPNQETQKNKNKETLILALSALGGSVFLNFILISVTCLGFYCIYQKKHKPLPVNEVIVETNLRSFTYKELVDATNEFKEELGRGAFGIVYKGTLQMSYVTQVAVKRLINTLVQGYHDKDSRLKNLVRLLGFCDDGDNRLLVYEYLSNGSLASFLFGGSRPSWSQRIQIALGIARGLLYLHEECSTQIIHCDIKPQNILLDEHYNAKISDFGLAKLLVMNQSHTNTVIRGTKGYVAAEWFRNLPITVKVDVYSFGVLLLELTCCRRSVDMESNMEERAILTDWAYDCYCEGTLDALVENDIDALNDIAKVERFVQVAIWCIQEDPSLRPTMRVVSQMLEGVVEVPHSTMPMSICFQCMNFCQSFV
ncbi:hypothetical protein GOBAR_AA33553 [Gossypium barbadense]|uniref:Receptor-like serine/threonine-protein kinase n=1 Tax=Gossypium barbadense TaxID=3634 RepID=A0A2P5W7S9_GOSBA|nr:hypothetical protein GOBAR_AA33553 [Gossypium barbadense]